MRATPYFYIPDRPFTWREVQYEPLGGMQTQAALMTAALADRIEQTVAIPRRPGMPRFRRMPLGTHPSTSLLPLPLIMPRIPSFGKGYAGLAAAWGVSLAAYCTTSRFTRSPYDLVHVHCSELPWCYLAALAAVRTSHVPVVLTVHCSAIGTFEPQTATESALLALARSAEARAVRAAASVIVLGERLKARYLGMKLAEEDKLHVIGDGVRIASWQGATCVDDVVRIGFVGRISPEKGWEDLLAAFGSYMSVAGRPRARLIFVGDGNEMRRLRSSVRRLRVDEAIEVMGGVGQQRAQELIAGLDIVVVPSRYEELGTTLLEAASAGRAIIASATGGAVDLFKDRKSIRLFRPGNVGELTMALQEVAGNASLRASLGRNACLVAQPFNIEDIADRTLAVYESAARVGHAARN